MEERKLNRNPDDRPIKGNQTGKYNMDFIDWQNEYSNIYSNYDPNNQDDDCPIYGMDKQTFVRLMAEEFEQGEYGEDEFFEPGGNDDKLPDNYLQNIKQMKIGQTIKQCSVCVKNFEKGEVIRKLPCKHIFHDECIMPWFTKKSNCPNCRFDIKEHFSKLN